MNALTTCLPDTRGFRTRRASVTTLALAACGLVASGAVPALAQHAVRTAIDGRPDAVVVVAQA